MNGENLRLLLLALLVSTGGTAVINSLYDPRPDPFTGAESEQLRRELLIDMRELEARIRTDMPPPKTRERIEALEAWVRARDDEYRPPSYRFSERRP